MKTKIEAGSFSIIRSPLLPLSVFENWNSQTQSEDFILSLYDDPLVDEALYLSSISLHARLQELKRGEGEAAQSDSERRKLIASLAKFISRAAYRCTPFGLFAQVQMAHVADLTSHHDTGHERTILRGIHLDGAVETRLIEKALEDHSWRETLRWQINNTAHVVGSNLSYVDWIYQSSGQRTYRSVELEISDILLTLKNHCQSPRSFNEICAILTEDPDIEYEDAREFLHELIHRRLLMPDLAPSSSDACTLDQALAKCDEHPMTERLRAIQNKLHAMRANANTRESLVSAYEDLYQQIEKEVGSQNLSSGILQLDSLIEQDATLDKTVVQNLVSSVELMVKHCIRKASSLADYRNIFRERFEDREVNLAYALHPELGVPYPDKGWLDSPLLDGVRLNQAFGGGGGSYGGAGLTPIDKLLIKKMFDAAKSDVSKIEITREDLKELPESPDANYALAEGLYVQVNTTSSADSKAPKFELRYVGGRTGLETITRFAHLAPRISDANKAYMEQHSLRDPNVIYAEIIHHPQDRMLNIMRRPRLTTHEIVYAGASDLPRENQIWIEDLTIQLYGDRFILRDRRSGKQVKPRLSSAHNYNMKQMGTYQFLAMLQDDDAGWTGFQWPQALREFKFLPRVEFDGLIISRATWSLYKEDIEALNRAHQENTVDVWRQAQKMPRFVTLDQGDNHLPVDFQNPASVALLIEEVIKLPSTVLSECLALNQAEEASNYSQFTQEWIMPLHLSREDQFELSTKTPPNKMHIVGDSPMASNLDEWVYLRVYTGTGYEDRILREMVGPVMNRACREQNIDRWFFIRYKDQFEHLRIRFHSSQRNELAATLVKLNERLNLARQEGLLWRIQTDDYVLEAERYGGPEALKICEHLFCIDSEDMLKLIEIEAEYAGEHQRWVYALASIDFYAQRLCPDLKEREEFLDTIAGNFLSEYSTQSTRATVQASLGGRFREMRKEIDAIKRGTPALLAWQAQLQSNLERRTELLQQLRNVTADLDQSRKKLVINSLMHMHVNRLAPSDPRRHETILYDFARRLERARQASKRSQEKVIA